MSAEVISKSTGAVTQVSSNAIDLDAPSIVRLNISRADVAGLERQGHDLVVRLANGEQIRIADFYNDASSVANELVLKEGDGTLWLAHPAAGASSFSQLHEIDELLAGAAGGGGGSSLSLPLILGGLAAAGGAVALAAGGGGSDGRADEAPGSGTPPLADRTPPAAPVASINANGTSVTGTGEPGATVEIRGANGTVIGNGTVGSNGSFTVAVGTPQVNGEALQVTQTDAAGNASTPTRISAPDLTAPVAPAAAIDAAGATVTGTGEPGATVTVRDPAGQMVGTATVAQDGSYTVTLTTPQIHGGAISVTQTDAASNASPATLVTSPDLMPPSIPTAIITSDGTVVTGTGEPGATVQIWDENGNVIGTGTVGPDGTFTVTVSEPVTNPDSLIVTQTDFSGNVSPGAPVTPPDVTAPAAPTATLSSDGSQVTGLGEPGATVTVVGPEGTVIGSAVAGPDGTFTVPLATPQANGETITVTQADAAGNDSPPVTIVAPDVTAPAAPTISVTGDGSAVTGTGEPGATVTITDPAGAVLGTATVAANGSYAALLSTPQVNGEQLTAAQSDAAGNASGVATTIAPDLTAPALPTATIAADGASVSGTGEPGATIVVRDNAGATIGTATVAIDGSYTTPLTPVQANGEQLSATQVDPAGNQSGALPLTAPDITAPAAPEAALDATGTAVTGVTGTGEPGALVSVRDAGGAELGTAIVNGQGNYTVVLAAPQVNSQSLVVTQTDAAGNQSTGTALTAPDLTAPGAPTAVVAPDGAAVTGTGEPGATVLITSPLGATIGTAVVGADGTYSAPLTPPQVDGEQLSVTQADPAGNQSPAAGATAPDLVADTDPPAPTAAVTGNGAAVTGTAIPGAGITVFDATGVVISTGIAGADGNYTIALAPPRIDGELLRVTQTEADGDVSPPATTTAPDLTAPDAPTAALDPSGSLVTGTGEVGATVTVTGPNGAALGSATVTGQGSYAVVLAAPQSNGEALSVTQADAAGNVSAGTGLIAGDTTAPAAPVATVSPDGTTVTGTGEPGATVTVADDTGAPVGTGLVAADGSFTVALATPQANGEALSVTATDPAGNASPAVAVAAPDITAPGAPTAAVSDDGGLVTGTGEAGATVTVTGPGGAVLGTAVVAANGSYTVPLTPAQTNLETVSVTQADRAGNVSPASVATAPDLTAPAAPAATVSADGLTVTGTGEAGATVTVRDPAGLVIGTATVGADGSYAVPLSEAQDNREALSVTQTDAAGLVSPATVATAPDLTPPAVPTAAITPDGALVTGTGEAGATVTITAPGGVVVGTALVGADGSYTAALTPAQANGERLGVAQTDAAGNASLGVTLAAPDITAPAAPSATVSPDGVSVTGTGEPGAAVTITNAAGTVVGTATVAADGAFVAPLTPAQANGGTLSVVQTDPAGNASGAATVDAPDITPPAEPVVAISGDGTLLTGTGEPGATLSILGETGAPVGTVVVGADGNFSVPLTPALVNGEQVFATLVDAGGNASPTATATAPDLTAPLEPTGVVSADGTTLTGTGEAGATVTVTGPGGGVIGSAVVGPDGTYAAPLTPAQVDGEVLSVTQADPTGNPSAPVTVTAPNLDAPIGLTADVNDTGTAVTGAGEAGATVTIRDPAGAVIGTAVVGPDGTYTAPLTPPQINAELLSATQADADGNISTPVTTSAPDLTAPDLPSAAVSPDGTAVTGIGEPGATVTVTGVGGAVVGTGAVAADGTYTVPLAPAQANGETLTVTQADATGNTSPAATAIAPDITPPTPPTILVNATGTEVTGTGEPGATVTILGGANAVVGTALVGADGIYTAALTPAQVNGELLQANQTDPAGNASGAATTIAPDLITPAAPTATVSADGATVTGTGEAGARIVITDPIGTTIGTATVDANGTYTAALTPAQRNGEVLGATQTDAVGHVSPEVTTTAPDLTAPAAPIGAVAPDGATLTGTGEPGAAITITSPAGALVGTATVGADGTFVATLTPAQRNGELLGLGQTDTAGNPSPGSTAIAPDLTAPAAPVAALGADGASVTGTGEPGATVTVTGATGVLGSAVVGGDGTYAVALATRQANGETLTVVQTDRASNASAGTTLTAPDTTAPAAPVAVVAADGTSVSGSGEPGATVTVVNATGTVLGTALVNPDGTYLAPLTTPQANGELLGVSQADGAGNVSGATPVAAPDITAPAAPTGVVSFDGGLVTGTGEPGAAVTVTDPLGNVIGTATVGADGRYAAPLTVAQDDGQVVTIRQADIAGNVSPPAAATSPDGTPPLVPTATVSPDGGAVVGTGVAGDAITVTNAAGAVIGTATVGADGTYSATLTPPQRNGELLGVTQADGAGNVSPSVPTIAPDLTAPAAPTATVAANGTTVTGFGEAGATVTIREPNGVLLGSGRVGANGTYFVTLLQPQTNGETVVATQADGAGNVSGPAAAVAPDLTAPGAPTGLTVSGDGTSVNGVGEPGATVQVRTEAGQVIGTSAVGTDGQFVVALTPPQELGGTLSVTQADAAGNRSGPATVAAPFDITAFANTDEASIDLTPVSRPVNHGTANYLALVSLGLLDVQAEVLSVPAVRFNVAEGHSFNASFTYDAVLDLGVASGYSVVVQRFDGTNWVAVDGSGTGSLVQLGLLNGNLNATETLGPGEYRAFLTFQGAAGVGLLGSLNVSGTDIDYTDVGGATPATVAGNVITDPGPGGEVDVVNADTRVTSVTVGGVVTPVTADGTVVDGAWGTLVINRDGSYSYTPDANAAAIGQTDSFTYTLTDATDGELASATLAVTIGSPDISGAPIAIDDSAIAHVTYTNVVTTVPPVTEFTFNTPGTLLVARTGSGADSFTVAPNSTSDVTITATRSGSLALLPSYTITVRDEAGTVVGTTTRTAVAGLPLGAGISYTLEDLPTGTYTYTVSSTNLTGTAYATTVQLGETITHLDQFSLSGSTDAFGNLLDNDTANSTFAEIRINTGTAFAEVADTPITVAGRYGTLTVNEVGDYTYHPNSTLGYSAVDLVDNFTYQLVQPNGTLATATLHVTVDVPADGVATAQVFAAEPALLLDDGVIGLASVHVAAEVAPAEPAAMTTALNTYDLFEGQGDLPDVLGRYLAEQHETSNQTGMDQFSPHLVTVEQADTTQFGSLDYLVSVSDQDRHETISKSAI